MKSFDEIPEKTPKQKLVESRDALLMNIVSDFQRNLTKAFRDGNFMDMEDYWKSVGREIERMKGEHKKHWKDEK